MPSRISQDGIESNDRDEVLNGLTVDRFDAVDYLNSVLPPLALSSQGNTAKTSRAAQLQAASSETQALLSKLNTHNIHSSSELSSLTDEILRSGNRLAYEVEILRGEVNSFYDLLNDTLKEDIAHFVRDEAAAEADAAVEAFTGPVFITQLRTLGLVKARLESVISVFGEAMKWPVPPSEVSGSGALISVSAPELGIQSTEEDDKARDVERTIRGEIQSLLDSEGGSAGLLAATKRGEQYRVLASIWKGTAEEKARNRFVDGLSKMVEDRRRLLDARGINQRSNPSQRSGSVQGRPARSEGAASGLFRNLARFKDDLYLE